MPKHEPIEFSNSNQFSEYVERIHIDENIPYIDIICDYCKENYIGFEDIKVLVHPTLKEKIKKEAIDQKLMKEIGTLSF
jgi:hypothetical protein